MNARFLSAGDTRIGQLFGSFYVAENADAKRPHVLCAACGALAQVSADALLEGTAKCTCPLAARQTPIPAAPPIARAKLRLRP